MMAKTEHLSIYFWYGLVILWFYCFLDWLYSGLTRPDMHYNICLETTVCLTIRPDVFLFEWNWSNYRLSLKCIKFFISFFVMAELKCENSVSEVHFVQYAVVHLKKSRAGSGFWAQACELWHCQALGPTLTLLQIVSSHIRFCLRVTGTSDPVRPTVEGHSASRSWLWLLCLSSHTKLLHTTSCLSISRHPLDLCEKKCID